MEALTATDLDIGCGRALPSDEGDGATDHSAVHRIRAILSECRLSGRAPVASLPPPRSRLVRCCAFQAEEIHGATD